MDQAWEALFNWLWQGLAVAWGGAALARAWPLPARTAYLFWGATLVVVVAIPLLTICVESASQLAGGASNDVQPMARITVQPAAPILTTAMLLAWIGWTATCAGRIVVSSVALRRAKRRCRPLASLVENRLRTWSHVKARGRVARVMISDRIASAAVLGFGSPIIAVNPALLDQLTDDEIDQVVVHEWSHVQRRDDAAKLLQLIVHAVAGWHPAVWWVNRQVSREREAACDAAVVAMTASPKTYALCLVKLATLVGNRTAPAAAVAAVGSTNVERRIARVLNSQEGRPIVEWSIPASDSRGERTRRGGPLDQRRRANRS